MKTYNNDIKYLKEVRELLVNIDMINGFCKKGTLAAPSIMRVVPRQRELLDEALIKDDTGIIFIKDSHPKNAREFKIFPEHCIEGSEESEVIDELKEYEKYSKVYLKNSTNLIFAPHIQEDLIKLDNLERIKLMGCLAEVCVSNGAIGLRTFFDQYNKDVDVCVYEDAIDTFDAPNHNADIVRNQALVNMEANGIKVLRRVK